VKNAKLGVVRGGDRIWGAFWKLLFEFETAFRISSSDQTDFIIFALVSQGNCIFYTKAFHSPWIPFLLTTLTITIMVPAARRTTRTLPCEGEKAA
jgi:hypothetical protein